MNYELRITAVAERDLVGASDYIEFTLKSPKAADDLLEEAEKKIQALSLFPEQFALVDDPILSSWGVRFTVIKNYLAFYVTSKEEHRVTVVRFLYAKSNWNFILKQGILLV